MPNLEINQLVSLCHVKGIQYAIISPGSRSAPLTLAFARHPEIRTKVVPDERAAGFMALGLSLSTKRPVVLICTSGSALLNYAPAISEAFYQQVPLIVLSADRPPEWIDQMDGQTIKQNEVFGKHVKASYSFPVSFEHPDAKWHANRMTNEAINTASTFPKGPVHINVPLREPLYPDPNEKYEYKPTRVIDLLEEEGTLHDEDWTSLAAIWRDSEKVLVAVGQYHFDEECPSMFSNQLERLNEVYMLPILGDAISNLTTLPLAYSYEDLALVRYHDLILQNTDDKEELSPDLLITFGNSFISKPFKQFLRKHKPKHHWHIQKGGVAPDTFQALTHHLSIKPFDFCSRILSKLEFGKKSHKYHQLWYNHNVAMEEKANAFFDANDLPFSELEATKKVLENMPDDSVCHLSNSMPVRYANYLAIDPEKNIRYCCNRGTSGIDGCTSTALGYAWATDSLVTLLTGDMAFFYDRNAFWHQQLPPNLRIVLFNNQGGNIFRMIKGPREQVELEDYFVTAQTSNAQQLATEHNIDYCLLEDPTKLEDTLNTFFDSDKQTKILEIKTDGPTDMEVFEKYKAL